MLQRSLFVGTTTAQNRVVRNFVLTIEYTGTGYAGSTYTSNIGGGQWYADETPISGETSQTYIMTANNEGKKITYRIGTKSSNSVKLFVPSHISGLVAWFDAADTTTLTLSGSLVSEWRSKVGIVRAIQNTSGNQPTWSETGRNSLPAIVASANKFLDFADAATLPSGASTSHIFATAYSSTANTGYRQLFNQASLTAGQGRLILRLNTGVITATASGSAFDTNSPSTWTDADRIVQAAYVNGSAIRLGVDGTTTLAAKTSVNYNTINNNIRLLAPIDGRSNEHWEGSIQEIMLFSRELAVFERQLIEGYMAAKWNLRSLLPVGHPYKSTMPVNTPEITLQSGTGYFGSTFETTDTGGQWYADDTAISGATGSTYTLVAEDEGKSISYRNSNGISNTLRYFVPPDVSVLVAWWDAAATSTLTLSGSQVASWASRVGTATWAQATTTVRPTWSATGRNSLPAVLSNGSNQRMTYSNGVLPTGTNVSHTMFLGFNSGGSGSFRCLMNWSTASGGTGRYFGHNNSVNVTFTGANSTTDNFTTISWANQDKIMSTQVTGTASTINVDGSTTAFTKTTTYNTTVNANAALFSTIASAQYWQGSAQDLIVYNRALSLADRQRVEGYMAAKWNLRTLLPSDHPFKSATPL